MNKVLNLIGILIIALLISGGYSFSQNNQQSKGTQNMDKQKTIQTDTNYAKSMVYYKYAKKNIIEDSVRDKTYKGKWHKQDNSNESMMNNSNMNSSGNNMVNPNNSMMNNPKNKMSHVIWDSTH